MGANDGLKNAVYNRNGGIDVEIWDSRREVWLPYSLYQDANDVRDRLLYKQAKGMDPAEYVAPPVVVAPIDVTRARNSVMARGFTWDGHRYQADMMSLQAMASAAQAAQTFVQNGGSGDAPDWLEPGTDYTFFDAENAPVPLTPDQVIDLQIAATAFHTRMVHAGREIKDLDPIPLDFADRLSGAAQP